MKFITSNQAPQAVGPYSQAVTAGGLVFCSGQIALDKDGKKVDGGIREQTERVLKNLFEVLKSSGSNVDRILKTTVYLKNMEDFAEMNEVYADLLGDHRPARATVAVAGLPKGALVEIECIAEINE